METEPNQPSKLEKSRSYERRRDLLRILAEHGPMTLRGIEVCLDKQSSRRSLRDVLTRLYRRGILSRRHDQITRRVFHQIGQHPQARRQAAEILKTTECAISQPYFRHAELLHSEQCAVWTELLRLLFPTAKVQRDFQLTSESEAQALLLSRAEGRDLLPDILLTQEAKAPCRKISVAVEIERTVKSKARLHKKLRKYAEQTRLDGLVYVTSSASLQGRILEIYRSKVMARALRISHYGRHFLLFSDGSFDRTAGELRLLDANMENVSLTAWLTTLVETKDMGRNDARFKLSSPSR